MNQCLKIALISRKGSVGKTTTAVNLGAALAAQGRKVLLVDLDCQASASLSLGVERAQLAPSIADMLNHRASLKEAVRRTKVNGLDLVTGSCDLASLDQELSAGRHGQQCLRRPLEEVGVHYDVLLMDCPAALGMMPVAALVVADAYLVALTPQFLVLDGLENFLNAVERLRFRFGSKARLLGLLLSQVDYRTRTTKPYVQQIRADFATKVLDSEVRVNVRLAEAPSFGQTVFEYAPDSSGASAYSALAAEILDRWSRLSDQRPRSAPRPPLPAEKPRSQMEQMATAAAWEPRPVPRQSEV